LSSRSADASWIWRVEFGSLAWSLVICLELGGWVYEAREGK